jgi:hypothetical protein
MSEDFLPYLPNGLDMGIRRSPSKSDEMLNGHPTTPFTAGVRDVVNEYKRAIAKFKPFNSPHEGLAIILEEYKELEEEVFKQHDVRTRKKMRAEAKQVAAMALRFMVDLT